MKEKQRVDIIKKSSCVLLALISFLLITNTQGWCKDKNGVSPNTISLPSGPGSIEGLGSSFQPMLNTGTARYAVKIPLPAGVAGHVPELSLQYDSGLGDGPAGLGWSFDLGSIRRRVDQGIPRYVDGPDGLDNDHDNLIDEVDESDVFVGPDGEELVQLEDGSYRARIESHFSRYRRVGDGWQMDLKNGGTLIFGETEQARISNGSSCAIFRWLLEKSIDVNGNVITYSYTSFPGSENQKYLAAIQYGPGNSPWPVFYFVSFGYENRPDWRKDYRSGFEIRTAHRLTTIHIGIQGLQPEQCAVGDWNQDGSSDALIARYRLDYDETQHCSLLSRLTRFGSDNNDDNYLPPISFHYATFSPPPVSSAAEAIVSSRNAPFTVMDSELVELIDLNRDGLTDILKTNLYGQRHTGYLNRGQNDDHTLDWADGVLLDSQDNLALPLHLAEDHVSLSDMNGDGLADLVHTSETAEVFYYANLGRLGWGNRQKMSVQDTAPPAPFVFDHVSSADFDFNKRIDVVQSTENGYTFWFNLENGRYSKAVHTDGARYQGRLISFEEDGVKTADMNGDRLVDIVLIRSNRVIYCASMGHGNFAPYVEMEIDVTLSDGDDGQLQRASLEDVNNDGLADLVVERAAVGEFWYWLNKGTDTFSSRHIISDMPTLYGSSPVVRWADMNGNSTTDLVYADSEAADRLLFIDIGELSSGSAHGNLLNAIENGLGVTTNIFYQSSTDFYLQDQSSNDPWTTTVPFPVQVVSRVTTATGLDLDDVPGPDIYIKDFHYRDGYYEDRQKQFRGFAGVTVTEHGGETAPTRIQLHQFFTGGPDGIDNDNDGQVDEVNALLHREEEALKGMVISLTALDEQGIVFNRQENSWLVRNLLISPEDIEISFAAKMQTDTFIYEGTATPETLRTTYSYDEYGNVLFAKNYGTLSIDGDEVFSFGEYINDTSLWLLGLPSRQWLTGMDEVKKAESRIYYDGADFIGLPLGAAVKGLVTRREEWVSGTEYVNSMRNGYDAYGNIITTLNANGFQRSVTYDPYLHVFPLSESIEVGGGADNLEITAAYNLGLGTVVESHDFNSHQSLYTYDTFGRLTAVIAPGDSPALPTSSFSYRMADPQNRLRYSYDADGNLSLDSNSDILASSATSRVREVSGQAVTLDTIGYVDGLGRKLATVSEGENGYLVNEAVRFNRLGSPRFSFLPYEALSPEYAPPAAEGLKSEVRYDAAGRDILAITPPDDNGLTSTSSVQFLPLHKIITDANVVSKDLFSDGLERLIRVEEHNQGETSVTRYQYDTLGNLTDIIDAHNNVKTMVYDGLKRRLAMQDPDKGHTGYEYDDLSNLIRTVDNKGQMVECTYDGAGRMLSEDFLDGAGISPDVRYHYDVPSADYPQAENLKGSLAWVSDLSGAQFFSFDQRGNPAWTVKRIFDQGDRDYRSSSEFDAMGRITSHIFPDNDRIEYHYNNRGLLQSIPGLLDNISYRPSGARGSVSYHNGVSTSYAYDPRERLNSLTAVSSLAPAIPIQQLTYTFDQLNNITDITDHRSLPADSPALGSQHFIYDDLSRLTMAEGPGYGRIDFHYDAIGNMISKNSPAVPDPAHVDDALINLGIMSYGGLAGTANRGPRLPGDEPGPHAVTSTESGLAYDYDDNGNMTSHASGDALEWDFEDRLLKLTTVAGSVSEYVYDHSGQRVIKRVTENGSTTTIYYVDDSFEVRDNQQVKFVFDGSRRVARIEGRLTPVGGSAVQMLDFKTGWNFFSLDLEPDNPAIAEVLAAIQTSVDELWGYNAAGSHYIGYVPALGLYDLTELHGRTGYLIRMNTPATLTVSGARLAGDAPLQTGWNLVASPVESPQPVTEALNSIAGQYESVWGYDSGQWQDYIAGQPEFLNNLNEIHPARACWLQMGSPAQLQFTPQPLKIYYYHPDHLGSSSLVTDSSGNVVEQTQYYPLRPSPP